MGVDTSIHQNHDDVEEATYNSEDSSDEDNSYFLSGGKEDPLSFSDDDEGEGEGEEDEEGEDEGVGVAGAWAALVDSVDEEQKHARKKARTVSVDAEEAA